LEGLGASYRSQVEHFSFGETLFHQIVAVFVK